MKGIIIYKSNYGSTEQYARWLAEETGYDCLPVKRAGKKDYADRDVVLLGCPVYAGNPLLSGWIKSHWAGLAGKKVIVFTCSGAPADDPGLRAGVEKALGSEIMEKISYHPLGGRMIFADLKPFMKFMMNLVRRMIKDPVEKENMTKSFDRMDRNSLAPLLGEIG